MLRSRHVFLRAFIRLVHEVPWISGGGAIVSAPMVLRSILSVVPMRDHETIPHRFWWYLVVQLALRLWFLASCCLF